MDFLYFLFSVSRLRTNPGSQSQRSSHKLRLMLQAEQALQGSVRWIPSSFTTDSILRTLLPMVLVPKKGYSSSPCSRSRCGAWLRAFPSSRFTLSLFNSFAAELRGRTLWKWRSWQTSLTPATWLSCGRDTSTWCWCSPTPPRQPCSGNLPKRFFLFPGKPERHTHIVVLTFLFSVCVESQFCRRRTQTLHFSFLNGDKHRHWMPSLLRSAYEGVQGEGHSDDDEESADYSGHVLALNGHKKYFCLFRPVFTGEDSSSEASSSSSSRRKSRSRSRSSSHSRSRSHSREDGAVPKKSSSRATSIEVHHKLDRLGLWMERLMEGTLPRLRVPAWPSLSMESWARGHNRWIDGALTLWSCLPVFLRRNMHSDASAVNFKHLLPELDATLRVTVLSTLSKSGAAGGSWWSVMSWCRWPLRLSKFLGCRFMFCFAAFEITVTHPRTHRFMASW